MKSSYSCYRKDRLLMFFLFFLSSMTFVVVDIGIKWLGEFKEFWALVLFMKGSIIIAPVVMGLSFLGIIASSILIVQVESEIEKEKGKV